MTRFRLMSWANNGHNQKSEVEVDKLVNDVILSPHFNQDDLKGFHCHSENARMDTAAAGGENPLLQAFKEMGVSIDMPSGDPNVPSQQYSVPGLWYRKITDPLAHQFHFSPFHLFHHSQDTGKDTRIYSELYSSDTFLKAHDDVHFHGKINADDAGCTLEKVIAALIIFSDATHLAQFGNAKAWPIYLAFSNLSKYFRSQPSSGAMHHLAYVPSVDILAHCQWELMHAVWNFLLDPDFMHAYHYGMVIECLDGVRRRVYPRIFTYSADYPEKVLLATIHDNGLCPCPRCLIRKEKLDLLGQKRDGKVREKNIRTYLLDRVHTARKAIYFLGRAIGGSVIDNLLKSTSHVPTLNAFINRIGPDFNPFRMLVVDQLHEFELGVWKALFTHLI
ncbi:hypothetical protein ARMSODRAFT_990468 [Armillaria solidipes]|uniref:Uncharacterized protein n=1 Tax=Armillaria solidipes TaxID=1076256 RepID=A0A2H3B095_9AGAR|nr:hypothetical protein ARMSODRAFT_990468 [Armillaria solidipes]